MTRMRLFASMSAMVDSQSTLLDEALATFLYSTQIRAFICVNPIVSLQIRLAIETLRASVSVRLYSVS